MLSMRTRCCRSLTTTTATVASRCHRILTPVRPKPPLPLPPRIMWFRAVGSHDMATRRVRYHSSADTHHSLLPFYHPHGKDESRDTAAAAAAAAAAASLCLYTMPRIATTALVSSRPLTTMTMTRFLSTTATKATTTKGVKVGNHNDVVDDDDDDETNKYSTRTIDSSPSAPSSSSSSSLSAEQGNEAPLEVDLDTSTRAGGLPSSSTMRQKLRDGYQVRKDQALHRADGYRDSAVEHFREFREHPRQSAQDGVQSFSTMLQKYGPVFVGTYLSVYFATLGTLFAGVQSGVLDPVVLFGWLGQAAESTGNTETASTVQLVLDFMKRHDFTRPYVGIMEKNPALANLAVAWIAVKFTEPIRLGIALTITPRVSRAIGYKTKAAVEEEPGAADATTVATQKTGTEKGTAETTTFTSAQSLKSPTTGTKL